MNKIEGPTVQAVDRAISLLKIIANNRSPIQLADLVSATGMNRTTVWRMLSTLESHNLIERDPLTKGYQIGYEIIRLAANTDNYSHLIRRALPSMERLRDFFQESVLLGVPKSSQILTVEQINPSHSIRIADYVNEMSPLHSSSNGKLFLSSWSEEELNIYLEKPLKQVTPFTMTDPQELKKELQIIRERGFGTTFGELDENENGISTPILDSEGNMIAFLSIAGPGFRFTRDKVMSAGVRAVHEANEISKSLNLP